MRSYKKIMPIFLIVALLGSVAYSVNSKKEKATSYAETIKEARDFAGKGVEVDAISKYKEAIAINPTIEIYIEAGEVYFDNDDISGAKDWYLNQLLINYPREVQTYLYGIRVYLAANNYRSAFSVYDEYLGRGLYLQEIEDKIDQIRYLYDLSGDYEDVGVFSDSSNTAAVKYEGLWGYVDASGNRKITYDYVSAGIFGTLAPVIDEEGSAYYIDQNGNVKINDQFILETDPSFSDVEEFQVIQSNMILAYNGSVWNYYDADDYQKLFGGYQNATPVTMGVGAVSEDGKTWAIISNEGSLLTDFVYDDVVLDEKGVLCRTNAIVVQESDVYYLIDTNGNRINSDTYEQAYAFYDGSYAACANGRNWFFVDDKGEVAISGTFQDARSFSNGLAAVKQNGKWGYIDLTGDVVIPCEFDGAGPFNTSGVAFVKLGERWKLLSLYQYNHN